MSKYEGISIKRRKNIHTLYIYSCWKQLSKVYFFYLFVWYLYSPRVASMSPGCICSSQKALSLGNLLKIVQNFCHHIFCSGYDTNIITAVEVIIINVHFTFFKEYFNSYSNVKSWITSVDNWFRASSSPFRLPCWFVYSFSEYLLCWYTVTLFFFKALPVSGETKGISGRNGLLTKLPLVYRSGRSDFQTIQ